MVSDAGPDAKYLLGDTIEVAATFSEPVEVDTTDGTPQIGLTIGSTPRTADYVRGSTRTVLVFSYEVTGSDADTNGASVTANSLTANSGTVRKRDSTVNAALAHGALSDQSAHQVDGSTASTTRPGGVVETFPFVASGTHAGDLQACTYFSPSTRNCNFSRLPYLGAGTEQSLSLQHHAAGARVASLDGRELPRHARTHALRGTAAVPVGTGCRHRKRHPARVLQRVPWRDLPRSLPTWR